MKNTLTTLLPALGLLTLASCAGTAGLSSTESDGVYYSSSDRTIQAPSTYSVRGQQGIDEVAPTDADNPEYSAARSATANSAGTEYYDDSYAANSRYNQATYRGMGAGYNNFAYSPYGMMGGFNTFSPYAFGGYGMGYGMYDPFYSPFYSPFGYGFGGTSFGLSLGFGSPFYRPFGFGGMGYGGMYDYYGMGLAGYGSPYGGLYNGYYGGGGIYRDAARASANYAPRRDRSREATSISQPGGRVVNSGGRGVNSGNLAEAPASVGRATGNTTSPGGRGRISNPGVSPDGGAGTNPDYNVRQRSMSSQETNAREGWNQRGSTNRLSTADQPRPDGVTRGDRGRVADGGTNSSAAPQDYAQPQRRSRLSETFRNNAPSNNSRNTYQSGSEQRSYSQPTRTYSEPSRSMSSPSFGGSSGGGSVGGGGGSGGRGRIR